MSLTIHDIANYLLVDPGSDSLVEYRPWYVGFNWCESLCWLGFALVVFARYLRFRRSPFEPLYALTFLIFSASDALETSGLTVLLLLLKATCILALLAQRKIIVQLYPGWRF